MTFLKQELQKDCKSIVKFRIAHLLAIIQAALALKQT